MSEHQRKTAIRIASIPANRNSNLIGLSAACSDFKSGQACKCGIFPRFRRGFLGGFLATDKCANLHISFISIDDFRLCRRTW